MTTRARNHLLLYLNLGYAALIVYASLYPLAGWHDSGGNPFEFLSATWPRYWTIFDLLTNVAAYLPFGFLCAASLRVTLAPLLACLIAAALGGGLSFAMELTQNFLPQRVPSNLDLACNTLGAILGACAGARWGGIVFSERHHQIWRRHVMTEAYGTDIGIVLVAAWLMSQLSPEILLFGSGALRQMLDLPPVQPFAAERFSHVEATIAAAGLLAAGLVCGQLLHHRRRSITAVVLVSALLVRVLAHAVIAGPAAAFAWITVGNMSGVAIGAALWLGASFLALPLQRAMAALALLFATVMVNVAPENPYLHQVAQIWQSGQFLNFNGLTRLICSLWPFLTLPWLMIYRPEKAHARHH